jgi:hypothetical protein
VSLEGPTRPWFCRQNRAGAEPRGRRCPYAFFRGRDWYMHMHKSDALLTLRNMHISDTFYNTKCFFNGIISRCSPRVLIFFLFPSLFTFCTVLPTQCTLLCPMLPFAYPVHLFNSKYRRNKSMQCAKQQPKLYCK